MNLTTTRRIALLAVPVALLLAACGDDSSSSSDTTAAKSTVTPPAGLVADGTLSICSDTPYEPFEFQDENGKDTGFDIDVLNAIATPAGLKTKVTDLPFDGILGSLAAGDCDVVASAVTITDERAKEVDFSDPYFDADQSLLVNKDSGITAIGDLDGKTVGVQTGTTGEAYAKEHATGAEVKSFEDADGMFAALAAGDVVALLQDQPVNYARTQKDDKTEIVETYKTDEQYGFAVKKGNTAVLEFLNAGLATMRDDGTYDEIHTKYFGS